MRLLSLNWFYWIEIECDFALNDLLSDLDLPH